MTKLTIDLNTSFLGKANVRRFSTIYRSLSLKPKSQAREYSKDVLDFISRNKLKPVHIYESLKVHSK